MSSLAYQTASFRQQKLLEQLSSKLGISTQDITNVTYHDDIPVEITYNRRDGGATRNVQHLLGGLLNDYEVKQRKNSRIENYSPGVDRVSRSNAGVPNSNRRKIINTLVRSDGGKANGL